VQEDATSGLQDEKSLTHVFRDLGRVEETEREKRTILPLSDQGGRGAFENLAFEGKASAV